MKEIESREMRLLPGKKEGRKIEADGQHLVPVAQTVLLLPAALLQRQSLWIRSGLVPKCLVVWLLSWYELGHL